MPESSLTIEQLRDRLMLLREEHHDLITEIDGRREALRRELAARQERLSAVMAEERAVYGQIREQARAHFLATGDKTPCPGVAMRRYTYHDHPDEATMLAYCLEHGIHEPLEVDASKLIDIAKERAKSGGEPIPIIIEKSDYMTTVASNLRMAITTADVKERLKDDDLPTRSQER